MTLQSDYLSRSHGLAHLAREALWVPLSIHGRDEALHYGFFTAPTTRSKLLIVALTTELFCIFLMESFRPKVFATECTEEMLRMPRLV